MADCFSETTGQLVMSGLISRQPAAGSAWDNANAGDSVKMFALKTAEDPTGTWLHEKRNVY
jgi:hypothetical protein